MRKRYALTAALTVISMFPAVASAQRETDAPMTFFVTSQQNSGNLGGLAGADAKCQSRANTGGLPGSYGAWLSTGQGSPQSRFPPST